MLINDSTPFISIIIPIQNEEDNLPFLICDLLNQSYSYQHYEVLFVNDHSTDKTEKLLNEYCTFDNRLKTFSLTEGVTGKKKAIWVGIKEAKGEFIITTDGDCRFPQHWLSTMTQYYLKHPYHLLIGPVFLKFKENLFNRFQSIEFLSLIASGAGAIGSGHPILCNGANLGGHCSLFHRARKIYESPVVSGDDIFLMLELKKQNIPMVFVRNIDAVVKTNNSNGFNKFFRQRARWTFKSRFYRDFDIITVAIVVLFTNVALLAGLFYCVLSPQFLDDFLLFYLLKCLVDYTLLYNVATFFKRKDLLKLFLIHQLFYIFYVSFVGLSGHFARNRWGKQ